MHVTQLCTSAVYMLVVILQPDNSCHLKMQVHLRQMRLLLLQQEVLSSPHRNQMLEVCLLIITAAAWLLCVCSAHKLDQLLMLRSCCVIVLAKSSC